MNNGGFLQRLFWASLPAIVVGLVAYGGMRVELDNAQGQLVDMRTDIKEIRTGFSGSMNREWRVTALEGRQQALDSAITKLEVSSAVSTRILTDILQTLRDMRKLADERFRIQEDLPETGDGL